MTERHSTIGTNCDLCAGSEGDVISAVHDLHLHTPGVHKLVRCRQCGLIRLESDERRGEFDSEYASKQYAPHHVAVGFPPNIHPIRRQLKTAALAALRSYPMESGASWQRLAGLLLARLAADRVRRVPCCIPDGRLLDVGCGPGTYVAAMEELGWSAAGLEPEPNIVARTRGKRDLNLVAGRIEEAPFKDHAFDVVTFWHTLEHTRSPARALAQAMRLLQPVYVVGAKHSEQMSREVQEPHPNASPLQAGGMTLLEVPNIESWQARLFGRYWFHLDPPRHRYHFSPSTLKAYLAAGGFDQIQICHIPSSVGLAGSLQALLNQMTRRRGRAIRESRLFHLLLWPFAALEALAGHGGCLYASARVPPSAREDFVKSSGQQRDDLDLSVIIVTWNCWPHLQRCLESLRPALAGLTSEIIVIDNNSTDETLLQIREGYPDIRVIEMGVNAGFAVAANRGLKEGQGRYLWLLNPDTIVLPTAARELVAGLERHRGAGVAGPRLLQTDGTTSGVSARKYPTLLTELLEKGGIRHLASRSTRLNLEWNECRHVPLVSGAAMCIRRAALERVGRLDESFFLYAEDMDLCRRLQAAGWQVLYCGSAMLTHWGGGSSVNDPEGAGVEAVLSMAKYMRKYHGTIYAALYRLSMTAISAAKLLLFGYVAVLGPSGQIRIHARRKIRLHRQVLASMWRGRQP